MVRGSVRGSVGVRHGLDRLFACGINRFNHRNPLDDGLVPSGTTTSNPDSNRRRTLRRSRPQNVFFRLVLRMVFMDGLFPAVGYYARVRRIRAKISYVRMEEKVASGV
jgi:hypothetical protein